MDALVTVSIGSTMKIRKATAQLVCRESSRAHGHTDSALHATDPIVIADQQEIVGNFSQQFSLPVNPIGPPTTSARNFDVEWYLEVKFDVPWASNPVVRAPIHVFGT